MILPTKPYNSPDMDNMDRDSIREMLVPQYLIDKMSETEIVGLEFLVDSLENTSSCKFLKSGVIYTRVGEEIEIILDVEKTISRDMTGRHALIQRAIGFERPLCVYVRSNRGTSTPTSFACVVSTADTRIPSTDICASFVLSAEDGLLTQIPQVSRSIDAVIVRAGIEERELVRRVVEEELDRVMRLSWEEIITEHEGYAHDNDLRGICADFAREAILQPDEEVEWTGELPDPENMAQEILSSIPWEMIETDRY